MERSTPEDVAYFAPDATQGSVTKRIVCFQEAGFRVTSFTFRRDRASVLSPVCENVDLGAVPNERYLYRAIKLLAAMGRLWRARDRLRRAPIYYARMLDSALIALLARRFLNPSARIYYEVCDVRRIMMNPGAKGRVARWLERVALSGCERIVVNSPSFVTSYFGPKQGYRGKSFVLENKIYARSLGELAEHRTRNLASNRARSGPVRIAWFGNLDCPETWAAIKTAARRHPDRVAFTLRGYPILAEAEIRETVAAMPNIEFGGPFNNRTDLADMYARVDAVLGLDLLNREGNSWWLLPNSLYEAGAFGRPLITHAGTATAARVEAAGTGWILAEPIEDALSEFVASFTWDEYTAISDRIGAIDIATFAGQGQFGELAAVIRADMAGEADPVALVAATEAGRPAS